MSTMTTIKVTGLRELERKLGPQLIAQPMRNFWQRSTMTIVANTKPLTPIDRGQLRNSISNEVDTAYLPRWAQAGVIGGGSLGDYAEEQEFGTRAFWPPAAPIEAWARRKGKTVGFAHWVRERISIHGIKKKEYLKRGTEASLPAIRGYVPVLAAEIEAQAGK